MSLLPLPVAPLLWVFPCLGSGLALMSRLDEPGWTGVKDRQSQQDQPNQTTEAGWRSGGWLVGTESRCTYSPVHSLAPGGAHETLQGAV